MHRKYGKDGVVCMSVSLDELESKEAALKFLQGQQAVFQNFLLAEGSAVWQEKLDIIAPPAVFIFDRAGKWRRFDSDSEAFTYDDVEKVVRQLLGL
jgi:hypothetical protein